MIRDMQDGMLDLEPPRKLFDHLSDEGVLLLNTSLTLAWIRKREDRSERGYANGKTEAVSRALSPVGAFALPHPLVRR